MKLIVILLCLWLDHYLHIGAKGHQLEWFNKYERMMQGLLGKTALFKGPLSLVVVALPVLLIVGILQLYGMFYSNLVDLILGVAVLLFCLGATPLQRHMIAYVMPKEGEEKAAEDSLKAYLKDSGVDTKDGFFKTVTRLMFWQSHERFFAVVFWFLILGPIGAITYRLISWFHDNALHGESMYGKQLEQISWLHQWAAWVPARLVSLSYTLVGNFMASFDVWMKMALKRGDSQEILVDSGTASLGLADAPDDKAQNESALSLIQRALLVWVLVIAVATLGQLFL